VEERRIAKAVEREGEILDTVLGVKQRLASLPEHVQCLHGRRFPLL